MLRRSSTIGLLVTLCVLAAAGSAGATVSHHQEWDVSITGKQTVTWSFSAESPENCPSYYGTASEAAKGNGRVAMSFGTAKKQPLRVETSSFGSNLRFAWDSLGEHRIPATWSKQGTFAVIHGKPCGWSPDDPEPLPDIAPNSGCGKQQGELIVYGSWKDGALTVQGAPNETQGLREQEELCPGVFEEAMRVDAEGDRCTPGSAMDGTNGQDLQELHSPLPRAKFIAGKKFTVHAHHEYDCDFPAAIWPGKPVLKADLVTTYDVTFEPRNR